MTDCVSSPLLIFSGLKDLFNNELLSSLSSELDDDGEDVLLETFS